MPISLSTDVLRGEGGATSHTDVFTDISLKRCAQGSHRYTKPSNTDHYSRPRTSTTYPRLLGQQTVERHSHSGRSTLCQAQPVQNPPQNLTFPQPNTITYISRPNFTKSAPNPLKNPFRQFPTFSFPFFDTCTTSNHSPYPTPLFPPEQKPNKRE